MADLIASLATTLPFLQYFIPALLFVFFFMWLYTLITPHNESTLIKENNLAAATTYVGTLIGFTLPIASVVANAVGFIDFLVWGIIAGLVQLITYFIFRLFYPRVSERIQQGETAIALKLAGISCIVGLLNAACITY